MINELTIFFAALLPLSERGTIPLAILKFGMSPYETFLISSLGNILPVLPLLFFFDKATEYFSRKFRLFSRFFNVICNFTRRRHGEHFHYWGDLALFILVATPLPFTGVYTASLAAFVFGIPKKHAFLSIILGVLVFSLIITITTVFGENMFKYLFS